MRTLNRHQPVARTRGPQLYAPLAASTAGVHYSDPMNAQLLILAFDWTAPTGVVSGKILEAEEVKQISPRPAKAMSALFLTNIKFVGALSAIIVLSPFFCFLPDLDERRRPRERKCGNDQLRDLHAPELSEFCF